MAGLKDLVLWLSEQLFWPYMAIFCISLYLSIKSRFIQLRFIPGIPSLIRGLKRTSSSKHEKNTVSPITALVMSISTGIGLGNIFGPIWAVSMGGPIALGGFLFSAVLGTAVTFCEVYLAVSSDRRVSHTVGPMSYIFSYLGPTFAKIYGVSIFILVTCWSATQAGTFADLLLKFGVPKIATAICLSAFIISMLMGGAKRIGRISNAIVPVMMVLFVLATLRIIIPSIGRLPLILSLSSDTILAADGSIFKNFLTGFGLHSALRWGFAKGIQATESGVGTAAFPHGAAETDRPFEQASLSMIGVYSSIGVCLLAGLTYLLSFDAYTVGVVDGPHIFAKILSRYFPVFGPAIFVFCAFLFSFGTIIGNSYNALQCYSYFVGQKSRFVFFSTCAFAVFVGCLVDLGWLWTIPDFFVLPAVATNLLAILIAQRRGDIDFGK